MNLRFYAKKKKKAFVDLKSVFISPGYREKLEYMNYKVSTSRIKREKTLTALSFQS